MKQMMIRPIVSVQARSEYLRPIAGRPLRPLTRRIYKMLEDYHPPHEIAEKYRRGYPSVQSMRYDGQADAAALLSQTVRGQRGSVGGEAC